jgi:hypothetical protein
MKLHHHTAVSVIISGLLYLSFKSWGLAIASLIAGIFIDLDHIIDYLREHGWPLRIRNFFHVCDHAQFDRLYIFFHGWEWLVLWSVAAWLSEWNPWITGAFIGLCHHMILDTIYSAPHLYSYSLIWRWKNNFNFDTVFYNLKSYKYKHRKYSSE